MANIKSQIKRNKQNNAARLRNRVYRGTARATLRRAHAAIEGADTADDAKMEVLTAIKAVDKAVSHGVIHKNNAARRKSRLMSDFNKIGK
ncbi:MAG: 30S ribosomal protein S20 [Anaerolineaceae bacterium]